MLRLLDEQEPRNRTSKLELPIPSVLVRLPAPCVGSRKTFPLYKTSGLVNQLVVASWKHPGRSPPSESTLQAADLVEGKRRAGPTSSVVARIYSQLEEQRVEHEHDNEVDEDRGVGARCPHGELHNTGWD